MKGKKILSLFCAAALTLSLAACGSKSTTDYSGQTVTGEISDIDGTAVTVQLGELSEGGMPSHDVSDSSDSVQTLPDKPGGETQSGNSSEDHASSDSSQPPAKPDSQSGSTDSQPPEMPSGQDSSSNSQSGDSGSQPPEKPDGEAPSGSAPGGMGGSSFTAGEESVTLDFANAEITKNDESIELSDLAEGDILFNGYTITLADGTVLK